MVEQQPDLDVCLWIIGGDVSQPTASWSKELQKLERLRHTLNLSSVVHFAGQQLQEVLPYYYNAADVVVMPSHYESFGMAAAEAMACGVPIITTNVAGISSLIDEEQDLLLTSVNNPLLLAQQMKSLLIDPRKRAQVSEGLREKVSDLDWANIADRIISIYKDATHAAARR
jgi:D-inositol-3-phosphate glycosyltransferase